MNASPRRRPLINSWSKALDYCRAAIGDAGDEQLRVLMLDARQKLIADEILPRSMLDGASFEPRRILQKALACSAMSIGDAVGIHMADYLILGLERYTSLRSSGAI